MSKSHTILMLDLMLNARLGESKINKSYASNHYSKRFLRALNSQRIMETLLKSAIKYLTLTNLK